MFRCIALGLSACVLPAFLARPPLLAQSPGREDFASLFREYRLGDADRAVDMFKNWDARRVGREARLPSGQDDAWSMAALALLHHEAAVAEGSRAWQIHSDRYRSISADLLAQAPADHRELREFCRDLLLVYGPVDEWPWQLDRREEAVRELRQAMAEAAGREPAWVYLAGLFLGQVHEEQKLTDEAEQAYRSGLAAHPTGQVIPMLLGRMLVANGRDAEGWACADGA